MTPRSIETTNTLLLDDTCPQSAELRKSTPPRPVTRSRSALNTCCAAYAREAPQHLRARAGWNHNCSCNCRKNAAVDHNALVVEHHGACEARVRETQTRVGASTLHLRVCSLVGCRASRARGQEARSKRGIRHPPPRAGYFRQLAHELTRRRAISTAWSPCCSVRRAALPAILPASACPSLAGPSCWLWRASPATACGPCSSASRGCACNHGGGQHRSVTCGDSTCCWPGLHRACASHSSARPCRCCHTSAVTACPTQRSHTGSYSSCARC